MEAFELFSSSPFHKDVPASGDRGEGANVQHEIVLGVMVPGRPGRVNGEGHKAIELDSA